MINVLSMAPRSTRALVLLGYVHIYTGRVAQGIAECEQALMRDRNLTMAHAGIAIAMNLLGRGEETVTHVEEALRLSPHDTFAHRWMMFAGTASCGAATMPKRWPGFTGASRPTAISRSHISISLPRWLCLGR